MTWVDVDPVGMVVTSASLPAPPDLNHPISSRPTGSCLQEAWQNPRQAEDDEHSSLGPTCDMRAHHILTQAFSILEGLGWPVPKRTRPKAHKAARSSRRHEPPSPRLQMQLLRLP